MSDRALPLHAASIKGLLTPESLTEMTGVPGPRLEVLHGRGLVSRTEGAGAVYFALTDAGREALAEWRAGLAGDSMDDLQLRYDSEFLPLNREFKKLCADWQESDEPWELIDEAIDINEQIGGFLKVAEAMSSHYGTYGRRFSDALERIEDGDGSAMAGARSDSFHGAWFELHEDLIQILGRDRADEEN